MNPILSYEALRDAVAGTAMAFRSVTDLEPAGGEGDKLFPPTYQGGVYAREERIIDGRRVPCVLLDSVQSQANRLELALLEWHRSAKPDEKPFPLVQIDFAGTTASEVGLFTALEAPHRIADAVFLASEIEELVDGDNVLRPFRHPRNPERGSTIGRLVDEASPARATGLFGLCPTALVFGMWDSHGARGGLGQKFQRALVSEIIGIDATEENRRPASRIDPLIVVAGESIPIRKADDKTWSVVDQGRGNARLAEIGLGNVVPSLKVPPEQRRNFESEFNHGGVSVRFARQIAVLSLPALRRLRFPVDSRSADQQGEADISARAVLAAVALAALARQWASGFSLRSRCDLVPRSDFSLQLLAPGETRTFHLTPESATDLLHAAVRQAKSHGLPWPTEPHSPPWREGCLTLRPNAELVKAVTRSRELAAEARE